MRRSSGPRAGAKGAPRGFRSRFSPVRAAVLSAPPRETHRFSSPRLPVPAETRPVMTTHFRAVPVLRAAASGLRPILRACPAGSCRRESFSAPRPVCARPVTSRSAGQARVRLPPVRSRLFSPQPARRISARGLRPFMLPRPGSGRLRPPPFVHPCEPAPRFRPSAPRLVCAPCSAASRPLPAAPNSPKRPAAPLFSPADLRACRRAAYSPSPPDFLSAPGPLSYAPSSACPKRAVLYSGRAAAPLSAVFSPQKGRSGVLTVV